MEAADAKAKLESEEEKHQLESILSLMPVNLYWQDTQGVILGCNQALVDMLDLTSSNDMIGKTVYDFFNIDEANVLAEINAEVIKTGKQHVKEETVTIRGKERVYLSQKMPLRNKAGEITGIVGISLDITFAPICEYDLVILPQARRPTHAPHGLVEQFATHAADGVLTGAWHCSPPAAPC